MNYHSYSLRDYKTPLYTPYRRKSRRVLRWALAAALPLAGAMLLPIISNDANALRNREAPLEIPMQVMAEKHLRAETTNADAADDVKPIALIADQPAATVDSPHQEQTPPDTAAMVPDLEWKSITVARGDSLAKIFKQENIDGAQLQKVLDSGDIAKKLTRIHPGQIIQLQIDPEASRLVRLRYDLDRLNRLEVRATDDRFESELVVEIPDLHRTTKTAEIESSLFLAGNEAGLPDRIIMELAEIFGWDIDFALDIRTGDKFAVLYEERYLDGEMIDTGRILAAEFVNQGKTYKAVRFVDDEGNADYYTPEGRSMRREFIRTPVAFSRISSKFSLGRKHPILNRIRAHKGVDYAAPTGTPIKATGNGKIVFRGTKGGYGRAVVIQHGTRYSTLYGHMSKFKGGLKVGSRVRQGDVIGYVGMSGLATGPHLHYEFLVNGVHRNPLTVKLPKANPLPKRYLTEFQQVSETNLALLESAKTEAVAALDR